ncbi:DUF805 domain-containing protein [Macrococcus lamae]|uniref:DUF805 domain-containing protein n=1 Tax=Macrococcus lamae TaxID=198484 RepID=A0A4R6BSP3_9STAP|nr:DUF805 domain-containing protein [Macrococcus lamae]TDM07132.1 DUF805 domain-containing protein [Macrococcus lamae]
MNRTKMGPIEAYKQYWKNAFKLKGRSRRAEYWWPMLINFIITVGIAWLMGVLGIEYKIIMTISTILSLIIFIPDLTVTYRRFQDNGLSGRWAYPLFALSLFNTLLQDPQKYALHSSNDTISTIITVVGVLLVIIIVMYVLFSLYTMIKEGEHGPNEYGEDPKEI